MAFGIDMGLKDGRGLEESGSHLFGQERMRVKLRNAQYIILFN